MLKKYITLGASHLIHWLTKLASVHRLLPMDNTIILHQPMPYSLSTFISWIQK